MNREIERQLERDKEREIYKMIFIADLPLFHICSLAREFANNICLSLFEIHIPYYRFMNTQWYTYIRW